VAGRIADADRARDAAHRESWAEAYEELRALEVANVVWCTGFHHDFSWIDVPGLGAGEPPHRRGVVDGQPGLYLVGLHFCTPCPRP